MAASLLLSSPLSGQLRREGVVPYPADWPGRVLVGLGGGLSGDASFPLSGLRGRLARLGSVTLAYHFAPGAVFLVRGDAVRLLTVEERGPSAVPLDEGVDDGRTHDAGDFRLGTLFRVLGGADGVAAGLHLEVKLPNSDEMRGIGMNTTDVFGHVFGSWAGGPWRANAQVGVGILEAPLERFVQDDVLSYGAELLLEPPGASLRATVAAVGHANTRDRVPLGTEDRGTGWARLELLAGSWRADAGLGIGYAGTSPRWTVEIGAARVLGL